MAGIKPATIQTRDVFICKGLSADNRWVGVSDTFMPEDDTQIIVVAKFNEKDLKKVLKLQNLVNEYNSDVNKD